MTFHFCESAIIMSAPLCYFLYGELERLISVFKDKIKSAIDKALSNRNLRAADGQHN